MGSLNSTATNPTDEPSKHSSSQANKHKVTKKFMEKLKQEKSEIEENDSHHLKITPDKPTYTVNIHQKSSEKL
jgi:hypothetical protein